jgi:DNA-binding NarL/FixJ family response regulator
MAIRVLIADDHAIVRAGLRTLITAEPGMELVGEATGGEEAVVLARTLNPDVAVLDLSMPDLDGLEATRRIKLDQPGVRILILTVHEDEALLREAIRSGASGYIIKHAAEAELVSAIHTVEIGEIYVHPKMIRALLAEPEAAKPPATPSEAPRDVLTPRETDVLRRLAQGYTNRQIAEELSLSIRTVEGHRSNLTEKLALHSRVDLVRYARKHGLLSNSE